VDLIETIRDAWGFTGLEPRAIVDVNAFGNVLVEGMDGRFWRICPEELSCVPVAAAREELERVRGTEAFREDWAMQPLVELALDTLGPASGTRCYCLKIPAAFGGAYEPPNFGTIGVAELLGAAGCIAEQIDRLPDGTEIELEVVA
jgi:hypothetical protein